MSRVAQPLALLAVVALWSAGCSSRAAVWTSDPATTARVNAGAAARATDCFPPPVPDCAPPCDGPAQRMPVDLPTVLRLAQGRSLDVRLVRERVRESHAEVVRAGQWVLPTVTPALRYQQIDGNVQATEGTILDVNKNNAFAGAGVWAHWEIGDGIYNTLAARQRAGAARASATAGLNDAALAAGEGYFTLLRAQAFFDVAQQSVELYEKLVSETQAAVEAGGGFRGDVLRARARLSHARVVKQRATEQMRVAAVRLREILDLACNVELYASEPSPVRLALVPGELDELALVRQAIVSRPEVRAAKMQAQAAQAELRKTTMGAWIPDVFANWEGGGFGSNFGRLGGTSELNVGLGWTVGPGGIGDTARQAAAGSRHRQRLLDALKVRQSVIREVASALAAVQERSQAIATAQTGVAEAEEALSLYRQRLDLGVGIPLDAITAEETLTQARLDYLDAVVGFNVGQLRLLRATGQGH